MEKKCPRCGGSLELVAPDHAGILRAAGLDSLGDLEYALDREFDSTCVDWFRVQAVVEVGKQVKRVADYLEVLARRIEEHGGL